MTDDEITIEEDEEQEQEQTPREKGEEIGKAAADGAVVSPINAVVDMVIGVMTGFAMMLTTIVPKGHKIWSGLYKTALTGMFKTSGADAIGFIARSNGEVEPHPVKWKRASESGEKSRWVTKDTDEEWGPGTEGRGLERIGKVPVAFFDETSFDRTSMLEARIAEAVDLGQTQDLYRDADIDLVQVTVDNSNAGAGAAVADGGQNVREQRWEIRDPGVLDDVLIDLSSEAGDAMRVSWRKSKELLFEKATTEEMQMQEQRGRIAESDPEKQRQKFMKIFFYAMIMVVAAAVGPEFVSAIFGSGGGASGGSSVVPFFLLPW